MKKDIESRIDLEDLIEAFYTKLKADEQIGFIFTEAVILDFDKHLPVVCDFWESVLLNNPVYKGNVMHKHIDLDKKVKLLPEHFDRWGIIFLEEINQRFEGDTTDELIRRVNAMLPFMKFKVESSRNQNFIQ